METAGVHHGGPRRSNRPRVHPRQRESGVVRFGEPLLTGPVELHVGEATPTINICGSRNESYQHASSKRIPVYIVVSLSYNLDVSSKQANFSPHIKRPAVYIVDFSHMSVLQCSVQF